MSASIWISRNEWLYYVNVADDTGELTDQAGPFDDHTDAQLAAERIADCVAGVLG